MNRFDYVRPATVAEAVAAAAQPGSAYLAAGTLTAPELWLDPLGAFVKAIPGVALALVAWAMADER